MGYLFCRSLSCPQNWYTLSGEGVNLFPLSLASTRTEINWRLEADKAVFDFTASTVSAYGLSTRKVTLSELKNDLPGIRRI
jgi:hypothetical protein